MSKTLFYYPNSGKGLENMLSEEVSIQLRLKKTYIQVKRNSGELTYGGDQGFFKGAVPGSVDAKKNAMGCGVIAFCDLLLYLGNGNPDMVTAENRSYVNRVNKEEDYIAYYNGIYKFLGGVSMKSGISGIRLAMCFNRLSRREKWGLRSRWGISDRKLYKRMEEMLSKDLPVILCIPMMVLKKDKKDELAFYVKKNGRMEKACTVSAHYVMVTGMIERNGEAFLEISSWGKKYYVNWNEYEDMIQTHFLGNILGNILYIRQKRK